MLSCSTRSLTVIALPLLHEPGYLLVDLYVDTFILSTHLASIVSLHTTTYLEFFPVVALLSALQTLIILIASLEEIY